MNKSLTKSQIADHLAEKADIWRAAALRILEDLTELAYKEAKNSFSLPGLGKVVLVHRKARKGINPLTDEPIEIPAKKALKFRFAKAAKEAILG